MKVPEKNTAELVSKVSSLAKDVPMLLATQAMSKQICQATLDLRAVICSHSLVAFYRALNR